LTIFEDARKVPVRGRHHSITTHIGKMAGAHAGSLSKCGQRRKSSSMHRARSRSMAGKAPDAGQGHHVIDQETKGTSAFTRSVSHGIVTVRIEYLGQDETADQSHKAAGCAVTRKHTPPPSRGRQNPPSACAGAPRVRTRKGLSTTRTRSSEVHQPCIVQHLHTRAPRAQWQPPGTVVTTPGAEAGIQMKSNPARPCSGPRPAQPTRSRNAPSGPGDAGLVESRACRGGRMPHPLQGQRVLRDPTVDARPMMQTIHARGYNVAANRRGGQSVENRRAL